MKFSNPQQAYIRTIATLKDDNFEDSDGLSIILRDSYQECTV